jgi:hypothetical protein
VKNEPGRSLQTQHPLVKLRQHPADALRPGEGFGDAWWSPAVTSALRGLDLGGQARVARRARADARGVGEGLRAPTVAEARARQSGVTACIKKMRGSGRKRASDDRPSRRKPGAGRGSVEVSALRRAFGEGLPAPARNRLNAAAPRLNHKPSLHKRDCGRFPGHRPTPQILGFWDLVGRWILGFSGSAPARPPRGPYGPHWWALRELPDAAAVCFQRSTHPPCGFSAYAEASSSSRYTSCLPVARSQ